LVALSGTLILKPSIPLGNAPVAIKNAIDCAPGALDFALGDAISIPPLGDTNMEKSVKFVKFVRYYRWYPQTGREPVGATMHGNLA
jgi:hypothetical protein